MDPLTAFLLGMVIMTLLILYMTRSSDHPHYWISN